MLSFLIGTAAFLYIWDRLTPREEEE